ncbi:MAG: hypothetical protein ACT4OI_07820, partial [Methanobacteriota archaeon]
MLPQGVEDAIEDIAADHTSGASRIARIGLKGLEALVTASGGKLDPDTVRDAVRRLSAAQVTNAALHNVTQIFARLVAEGERPDSVLENLRAELDSGRA